MKTTNKAQGRHSAALTFAALVSLGAFALSPVRAQDAAVTPPAAPAPQPGPATAPPPPPGTTTPAPEQAPAPTPAAPPPNYKIQYTGLIDGYLQYSFQNPAGTLLETATATGTLIGGAYNARIKTPTLALAELNVFKNAKPGGVGFKSTLIAGDIADQNALNFNYQTGQSVAGTGEAQFKNIMQLYGTYAFSGAGGGIDIGKFYTPFGYEVTEANADYNYTRSLPYGLLPFYHAGVRVYSPSYNGLTVTGYVTQALFNTTSAGVHDDNNKKAYIGQLNYTDPKGKVVAIGTYGAGKDRFAGVDTQSSVFDGDLTYNFTPTILAGANYTYVKFKPDGGGTETTDNGYAFYLRQALTPKTAYALRFSGFKTDLHTPGTPNPKPTEFTATYELKPASNFTTRLEYRHNSSNLDGTFLGHGEVAVNGGTKKQEDLVILAGLFTF